MPSGSTIDPRQALANALAPPPTPFQPYRKGKVTSIVSGSGVSYVYVAVDGTNSTPRKCQWQGSGSFPAPGDFVYYIEHSPLPLVIGKVPVPNADHDMGDGTVSAGGFVDDQGNIRDGLNSNSSSISSLQSTVTSHTNSISSLNSSLSTLSSTVSGHTTTLNSHSNSISTLNAQMSSVVSTNTAQQNTINALVAGTAGFPLTNNVNSLLNRVANLEALTAYYASNMDYLARLGAHYSGHTAHPPGGF